MQLSDRRHKGPRLSVVAIGCFVAQMVLAPHLAIAAGHPNFAVILTVLASLLYGGRKGVVIGFLSGLVYDLLGVGVLGPSSLCLSVAAFILGSREQEPLSPRFGQALMRGGLATLAIGVAFWVCLLVAGQAGSPFEALIFRVFPEVVLTLVFLVPLTMIFARGGSTFSSTARRPRHSL